MKDRNGPIRALTAYIRIYTDKTKEQVLLRVDSMY